ncbi:amidohydrolase [Schumannella luteola]|uniref:Amidohydrolase 3 domain-containing protein n=1 Tax=Schumannella luteola TaxID=472059 RepID=A0A852Y3J6_9MICO|nr:amidohydrolase [Schumannella luteola]NYG97476.1 hypothetical protein [Schumannella luteola]TPX05893.1 amidohydrolase [Schumannella luteola]
MTATPEPSATLFSGGTIWSAGAPDAEALLVVDGLVAAIGAEAVAAHPVVVAAEAGSEDGIDIERVDLADGFLAPSFGDGHAHPLFGGLENAGPRIRGLGSIDAIVAEVRRFADANPVAAADGAPVDPANPDGWIVGASYDGSLAPGGLFDARWLDAAVPDRPVVLRAWDYHTVWCNSRALELAGIDTETPEPAIGEIPRRDDGSPLGVLREWGAVDLVMAVCPPLSEEVRLRALADAVAYFRENGVTWVQDAWVDPADARTYVEASRRGLLGVRFNLAFYADPRHFASQFGGFLAVRAEIEALGDDRLTAHTVKFFADGVIENETGALLQPYCSGAHDHGMQVWDADQLAEAVRIVDEAGFQVHIHAIGDAAVRMALDALEAAARENGPRGARDGDAAGASGSVGPASERRHVIAHAQLVDDADLDRFRALGVTANMQPLWAQLDALMTELTIPRLGELRAERQYRMRTLIDGGGHLSFGSDWPCSSGDPREGLAVAVSRQTDDGVPAEGWTPHELLTGDEALTAYTAAVAHQAFADLTAAPWGRIEVGARADLVWLDVDPRSAGAAGIRASRIRASYLDGVAWRG